MSAEQMVQVKSALLQQMVAFIEKASKIIEKASADREQAKEAAPQAVDTLIKQGLLGEEQRETATEALGESHARTVETLRRTATHAKKASEATPSTMGEAADGLDKSASEKGTMAEADDNFLRALGFGR
jgi:uncharacterized protein YhaN